MPVPPPRVAAMATVRTTEARVRGLVDSLLAVGVEHVFVYFDAPGEPDPGSFEADDKITAVRCDESYWTRHGFPGRPDDIDDRQLTNARDVWTRVRDAGFDWLLGHVDDDERMKLDGTPLPEFLARHAGDADYVRFPPWEAVPSADRDADDLFAVNRFKVLPARWQKAVLYTLSRRFYRYGYFRGHHLGKSATRVTADIGLLTVHKPEPREGEELQERLAPPGVALLHYDASTFAAWREKWRIRSANARHSTLTPRRMRQFEECVAAFGAKESGAALWRTYRRQCLPTPWQEVLLRTLGLLRRARE